jgi:hypothetical protein
LQRRKSGVVVNRSRISSGDGVATSWTVPRSCRAACRSPGSCRRPP